MAVDRAVLGKLIQEVRGIGPDVSELEQNAMIHRLESMVSHPAVIDLIYWPQYEFGHNDPTTAEIVDRILAYRPIAL